MSGIVIHKNDLGKIERCILEFSWHKFPEKFKGNEIHIHDIFKGRKEFEGIEKSEAESLLTKIYEMVEELSFSVISIAIDKSQLRVSEYAHWDVLETAYMFLAERFHNFLRRQDSKGMIRIDMTSNKEYSLSKKDNKILNLISNIRRDGTNWQSVKNIIENPIFLDSKSNQGIQVADAVAYCTNRVLNESDGFVKHWRLIYPKIQKDDLGEI